MLASPSTRSVGLRPAPLSWRVSARGLPVDARSPLMDVAAGRAALAAVYEPVLQQTFSSERETLSIL